MRRPLLAVVLALVVGVLATGPAVATDVPRVAPPTIVPFEDWAPADCPRPTGDDVSTTQRVVVHHSHDPVATTPEQVRPTLAELCRIHVARGFETVGYHYVVDPWGTVWQGRGALPGEGGAAPTAQPEGAHVQGGNPGATGVVFLGDHQATPPTDAAVAAGVQLLAWLVQATGKDPGELVATATTGGGTSLHAGVVQVEALAGHQATNATLCPGIHLLELLPTIREHVRTVIASGEPRGTLAVSDQVRAARDGEAQLASSGPILRAPDVLTSSSNTRVAFTVVLVIVSLVLSRRGRSGSA